ncbi:MAG: YihY/virulence factor BrkB family protein [Acidimicrobiales bacterium]|nr:YihY/virulence factor BrkB family protein [Acidimicrobiales bacterium]
MEKLIARLDELQRRNRPVAFLWAVQKKFNDDQGGHLAALITYYGFLSVFPLLLAAFTIVAYVLAGDQSAVSSLERHIGSYPIIGTAARELEGKSLEGSPIALAVGVLGLIWGAQGLAQIAQYSMDEAWNVAHTQRPGFVPRLLRTLAWYSIFGVGVLASTFVSSLGSWLHWNGGPALSSLLAFVVSIALFTSSFWILSPPGVGIGDHLPGAIAAGAAWSILTGVGVGLAHRLAHTNALYGTFAPILGFLAIIYLTARITVLSIEANVVRRHRLWPRSLTDKDLTPADCQQLESLATRQARIRPESVRVDF